MLCRFKGNTYACISFAGVLQYCQQQRRRLLATVADEAALHHWCRPGRHWCRATLQDAQLPAWLAVRAAYCQCCSSFLAKKLAKLPPYHAAAVKA
jgi:hypothetical protein